MPHSTLLHPANMCLRQRLSKTVVGGKYRPATLPGATVLKRLSISRTSSCAPDDFSGSVPVSQRSRRWRPTATPGRRRCCRRRAPRGSPSTPGPSATRCDRCGQACLSGRRCDPFLLCISIGGTCDKGPPLTRHSAMQDCVHPGLDLSPLKTPDHSVLCL